MGIGQTARIPAVTSRSFGRPSASAFSAPMNSPVLGRHSEVPKPRRRRLRGSSAPFASWRSPRLSEVLTLKWEFIDFERATVRLPDSKTGAKTLYLNAPALAILSELPRVEGNPFVIVGERKGVRLINLQKPWRRIRKAAGLDDVRLHDLRHSFASVGAASGMSLPTIGALLGHSQPQTTNRYAHLAADPLRTASETIAAQIAGRIGRASREDKHISVNIRESED